MSVKPKVEIYVCGDASGSRVMDHRIAPTDLRLSFDTARRFKSHKDVRNSVIGQLKGQGAYRPIISIRRWEGQS